MQSSLSQHFFNFLLDQLIQPIYRFHEGIERGFQKTFIRPTLSHCSASIHQGSSATKQALKLAVDSGRRAPGAKVLTLVSQKPGQQPSVGRVCFNPSSNTFPVVAQLKTVDDINLETQAMGQLNQVQVINIGRLDSDSGVQRLLLQPSPDFELGIF
ncbi:hypothetical protein D3C81_1708840 [compost metagenome]